MQSELCSRETTKPTDMQNKLSLDLTLRNLIRGGLGNPSDLKKKNYVIIRCTFPDSVFIGFVCLFFLLCLQLLSKHVPSFLSRSGTL